MPAISDLVARLRELGLDDHHLSETRTVTVAPNGTVHRVGGSPGCTAPTPVTIRRVVATLPLEEVLGHPLCPCVEAQLLQTQVLEVGRQLLSHLDGLDPTTVEPHAMELHRAIAGAARVSSLVWTFPQAAPDVRTLCDEARRRINAYQGVLTARLRTPAVSREVEEYAHSWVGDLVPAELATGTRVFPLRRDTLPEGWARVAALTYTKAVRPDGWIVVVAPASVQWFLYGTVSREPGQKAIPSATVATGEESGPLAETAAALWEPTGAGPLSDFPAAVEAARACLAP